MGDVFGNQKLGKNNLVEDWMDVENSAVTHELLSDEVNAMMDFGITWKLKQAAIKTAVMEKMKWMMIR